MKATIEVDDTLLRQLRRTAAEFGFTLREMLNAGLQSELKRRRRPRGPVRWVSASGHWPEGLDISSREKMWEWLERKEDEETR